LYDTLYNIVKNDRRKHAEQGGNSGGITFNKELYKFYQQRRDMERNVSCPGKQGKQPKVAPYQCIDEFDDDSDDEGSEDDNPTEHGHALSNDNTFDPTNVSRYAAM
jgi:hypothetical protein